MLHREPLHYRNPTLVAAILGMIYDADEPVGWLEIIDALSPPHEPKTVTGTLYDLIAYGAIHRIGQPGTTRKPDTRALKPTPLGRHWLEQIPPPPLPGGAP